MSDPHVMVDLETYDTRPTAAILSIGACLVDLEKGEVRNPFYTVVDLNSCIEVGLTESKSTADWWSQQSAEARKVFTDPSVRLDHALADFAQYLRSLGPTSKLKLWGNGSDFDNTILANAYAACGYDAPWRFYNNRCFRTIRKGIKIDIVEPDRAGTYHNALDDAIHQGRILLNYRGLLT